MQLPQIALFVGMLIITTAAAGQDKHVKRSDAEKKAIAAIEKSGGEVTVDEENPRQPVIAVNLDGTKVTDAGLEHLKGNAV